jgi:transposase
MSNGNWWELCCRRPDSDATGAVDRQLQSSLFQRHLVDSPDRRGLAVSAGRVSLALHLLATAPTMGTGSRVAEAWRTLLGALDQEGLLQWDEAFRRQLRSGEKGGLAVGKIKRGKGTKWMVLVDGEGLPLGVRLETASPAEATLAEATLAQVRVPRPKNRPLQRPEGVVADRGYDSDPLRQRLRRRGIELIVPYRENNEHRHYQDGRELRRYKRRWIVERTNAWLGQFPRLLVRHEYLLCTYRAFFYLACLWITLRNCLLCNPALLKS